MPNFARFFLLVGFFIIASFGCATTGSTGTSTAEFMKSSGQKEATEITSLAAGDSIELSVEVDGVMEVSLHRAVINHKGIATLPLVGDVRIGGLSMEEARAVIANTYGGYYVHPPVVMVSQVEDPADGAFGYVTMTGKFSQPGLVQIRSARGIKLTAAIQAAGGFAPSAKQNEIRISRVEKDGRKIQVAIDYNTIGQQGNADADVTLVDGDIVYVPERIF